MTEERKYRVSVVVLSPLLIVAVTMPAACSPSHSAATVARAGQPVSDTPAAAGLLPAPAYNFSSSIFLTPRETPISLGWTEQAAF